MPGVPGRGGGGAAAAGGLGVLELLQLYVGDLLLGRDAPAVDVEVEVEVGLGVDVGHVVDEVAQGYVVLQQFVQG